MKNRIEKRVTPESGFVIKRFRVSRKVKECIKRYAKDTGVSQRDVVTHAFIVALKPKSKARTV